MAKGPKSVLSFPSSLQFCRPRVVSSLVQTPLPKASYLFSQINSKSFAVSFPSIPSPLTPPPSKRGLPKSCILHQIPSEFSSNKYYNAKKGNNEKTCNNSTNSSDFSEKYQAKAKLKKSPPRLGSSSDHYPLTTSIDEETINEIKHHLKQRSVRTRRFKRFGSKEWKDSALTVPEEKPVSGRLVPCLVDGKVNHGYVVMKKSINPYEDFKKSMLEMILEKNMTDPRELEQLLMSFLSLNSRLHHQVIIEAFTEIWKEVLCGGSTSNQNA